jgi:hypothetical protein
MRNMLEVKLITAYFSSDAYELMKIVKQPLVNINVLQDENSVQFSSVRRHVFGFKAAEHGFLSAFIS